MIVDGTTVSSRAPVCAGPIAAVTLAALLLSAPIPAVATTEPAVSQTFFPLEHHWIAELDAPPAAPPALDDEAAYVPLRDGTVVAIRLRDGTVVWTTDLATHLSPAAGEHLVVLAGGTTITGLRADDAAMLWSRNVSHEVTAPLVLTHGWLVVGLEGGELLVLRAADGALIWREHLGGDLEVAASLGGPHLFVPVADGRVVAFEIASGQRLWEARLGGAPQRPLPLDDLFVGAADNFMYCLSRRDGRIRWQWRTGADIVGTATVDQDRLFFVSLDNILRALDRDSGVQQWRQPLPGRPTAGPRLVGDLVLVSGVAPRVLAFDTAEGRSRGIVTAPGELAAPPAVLSDPSPLAPGLVLTMGDGRLALLGTPIGPPTFSLLFPPPPLLAGPELLDPADVLPFDALDSVPVDPDADERAVEEGGEEEEDTDPDDSSS